VHRRHPIQKALQFLCKGGQIDAGLQEEPGRYASLLVQQCFQQVLPAYLLVMARRCPLLGIDQSLA
jgi:hypothetical protein